MCDSLSPAIFEMLQHILHQCLHQRSQPTVSTRIVGHTWAQRAEDEGKTPAPVTYDSTD